MSAPDRDNTVYLQMGFQLAAAAAAVAGIALSATPLQNYWPTSPRQGVLIWLAISASFILLCKLVTPRFANLSLIAAFTLFIMGGNGVTASLSCTLFCLSVFSAGRFIARVISNERWNIASIMILGLATYAAIFGAMIHFPINYRWIYLIILCVPVLAELATVARQQNIKQIAGELIQNINAALSPIAYWKLAALLTVIGFFSCYSFMLSITSDDNSYHLAMWSQLQFHHRYLFDVKTQIWYAAPFTLDMIHGVLSVVANQDVRGAMNISLLIAMLTATLATARQLFTSVNIQLLSLAFLASTPMLYNLLLGLQTELMLATLAITGVYIGINQRTSFIERGIGVILVACLLVAIKLPTATLSAALGLCLLISERKNLYQIAGFSRAKIITLLAIFFIGLAIALHPYVTSYLVTGNPVFPLYNAIFKSPYYNPVNFKDNNFTHGASLQAWWGMFFNSSQFLESKNFITGFQYFLLPLAGILCLGKRIRWQALLYLALPVLVFGGAMFFMVQYVRYLFPVMPIACLLAAGVCYVPAKAKQSILLNRLKVVTTLATFVTLVSLNIYFLPGVSWIFNQNPLKLYTYEAKLETAKNYNAEYVMNVYLNEKYPGANVLYDAGRCNGASLLGKPFYPDWISPFTLAVFDKINSEDTFIDFLKANDVRFVYWDAGDNASTQPFRNAIKAVIDKYGKEEMTVNKVTLYKITL
jgi:hypothetical protein